MNKSRFLVIVLGVYWTLGPCLENSLWAEPRECEPNKQEIGKEDGQAKPLTDAEKAEKRKKEKFAKYPEHIRTNYYCILKNIPKANEDFVAQGRKISSSMEDSIKKYGIKKVVGLRNIALTSCLDLALERINHKIPEKDFDKRTKEISKQCYGDIQDTNVSAPIDFRNKRIIRAYQKKVRLDIVLYEKLLSSKLKAKKDEGDYKKLVQAAFSEKEYSEVISKRLSAIDGIYDAFLKSRVGFRGAFAKSGINKMRKFAIQYYKGEGEKMYPTKAGKDGSKRKKQVPGQQKGRKK